MITATIIAVALGLVPVDGAKPEQTVSGNYDALVGAYSQTVDPRGTIRVRGVHPRTGASYELTIDRAGYVEANLGDVEVHFRAQTTR